ncbi:flagellar hook-associated protein 3 FlgL [Aeromonas sp. RU39B]|uniref:flagellar hook-associated protein FlgL n=1 Tax=Aeromonas sp. RU39B TaxID=1907416 RepID=UPI0009554FE7|nr:flagellar hook-associated protein FlgL [Aeromonas sp. RU39B]SIR17014.1 flagellar hook-associated protein 3 FlgL [Aeromonas sp. RU39B]
MRVSSSQTTTMLLKSMQSQYSKYYDVSTELSTGSSINSPSDDAIGYARVSSLTSQQTSLNQYLDNIETASSQLDASETQMSSMTDVISSIRDLVVQAANDTYSSDDLSDIATEIQSLVDTLVDLCNATDSSGNYLFSGSLSSTAPISYDETTGTYTYVGNDYQREVVVGDGITVASTDTLSGVLASSSDGSDNIFNDLSDLITALQSGDNSTASSMLDTIDEYSSSLSTAIASIGARSNQLDTLSDAHTETLTYSTALSDSISSADYAEVTVESEEILTTLQVTQQVLASVMGLSLFDEI